MQFPHAPVLKKEFSDAFKDVSLEIFIDGTLGAGGHAEALLAAHPEIKHFIGCDQDPNALKIAEARLKSYKNKTTFFHCNFAKLPEMLAHQYLPFNGMILDLGVSSMQLDQAERGFSFNLKGPLDMRMDPDASLTAADVVNNFSEEKLGEIFRNFGEEKQWRKAASLIVSKRTEKPFENTADLVEALYPHLKTRAKKGLHPLTLIFQALRIFINSELEVLSMILPFAIKNLASGGRLAVISFHSLEDRIIKNQFNMAAADKLHTSGLSGLFIDKKPEIKILTKKPLTADLEELQLNPRSRSAKMRVIEKL